MRCRNFPLTESFKPRKSTHLSKLKRYFVSVNRCKKNFLFCNEIKGTLYVVTCSSIELAIFKPIYSFPKNANLIVNVILLFRPLCNDNQ